MKRTLLALLLAATGAAHAAFDGHYDQANWTQTPNGGAIYLGAMPELLRMVSADDGSGNDVPTDFTIAVQAAGSISFSWAYLNGDIAGSALDPFGYLLNSEFVQLTMPLPQSEGEPTLLSSFDPMGAQSGTKTVAVQAGDIFGFRIYSTDTILGASTATVYNFSAPIPEPESYALMLAGLGLVGFMARRRMAK